MNEQMRPSRRIAARGSQHVGLAGQHAETDLSSSGEDPGVRHFQDSDYLEAFELSPVDECSVAAAPGCAATELRSCPAELDVWVEVESEKASALTVRSLPYPEEGATLSVELAELYRLIAEAEAKLA